jgi:hypothetical protein
VAGLEGIAYQLKSSSPVVFLHVGALKTGTTYLQQLLLSNRESLAGHGLLFPGRSWGDQVLAAHDVVGQNRERGVGERAAGSWPTLVGEMLGHDGRASVLSVEFLSFAGPRAVRRVMADLAAAEVHVVLTIRDTCVVLPGLWQTHCANGGTASWRGFAQSARLGTGTGPFTPLLGQGARLFRRALDVPRMVDSWAGVVPPERLHVVTVPPAGSPPEHLWERFASVLGVDPAAAPEAPKGHEPSLGYASADLMRRLNAELGRLPRERYNPTLKHHLAERVLAERAPTEARAGLDAATHAFATRWNRRTRAALEASGVHVVGDLEDLPTTESPQDLPSSIEPPPEADLIAAAEHAVAGMEELVRRRRRRLRKRRGEAPGRDGRAEGTAERRQRWDAETDPVRAAVRDLADVSRVAIALQDRLHQTRPQAARRAGR